MELRHLRYFVAVVDAGSVSRAAARLKISQPALSRQIRDLETELGVSLFQRRAGRLLLTGEGEDLATRSRELMRGAESLRERAQALRGGDAGIIRVGVAPLTLQSLLPSFLAHHQRRHPKVDICLFEDSPGNLSARLQRGELNVAISFPGHDGLGSRLLFPVCTLALMSPNHRLARRKTLDVDELAGERLLLLGHQFLTRQWFDTACRRGRLRPIVALESTTPHVLVALARVDYGIAIVPSHTPFDRRELRGACLAQRGTMLGAWAAIAWDRNRFQPPFVVRFVEELVQHARRAYPGREVAGRNVPPSTNVGPAAIASPSTS